MKAMKWLVLLPLLQVACATADREPQQTSGRTSELPPTPPQPPSVPNSQGPTGVNPQDPSMQAPPTPPAPPTEPKGHVITHPVPKPLDREGIRKTFIKNQRTLQGCYEKVLKKNKDIAGKMKLDFDIGDGGKVLRSSMHTNETGSDDLARCLVDSLKKFKFPPPPDKKTIQVFYPLYFEGKMVTSDESTESKK